MAQVWNFLDWVNFVVFFMVYRTIHHEQALALRDAAGEGCTSRLCTEFGYYDSWEVFAASRSGRFLLSICVCIQFLKIIKSAATPHMAHSHTVRLALGALLIRRTVCGTGSPTCSCPRCRS